MENKTDQDLIVNRGSHNEAQASGVAWSAIFAGATVTSALSLLLLMLGVGLGLSAVSPWTYGNETHTLIAVSSLIWLFILQLIAGGLGGYLAGRLRSKWVSVHTDEVYFRDTAHGLLSWALATLAAVVMLSGATHAILKAPLATPHHMTRKNPLSNIGMRFHGQVTPNGDLGKLKLDGEGHFDSAVGANKDESTQLSKEDMEEARQVAARSMLWMFAALLFGAFISSLAATLGGRQRDNVEHVHRTVV